MKKWDVTSRSCDGCKFRGKIIKIPKIGVYTHCEYPDVKISGIPGWDSLRSWSGICKYWEKRDNWIFLKRLVIRFFKNYSKNK